MVIIVMDNDEIVLDVEYCNKCGYLNEFEKLASHIQKDHPDIKINGREGRRGSFEVQINGTLVHSKLSTLAYPDYSDLSNMLMSAKEGKQPTSHCKQQPITDCCIS